MEQLQCRLACHEIEQGIARASETLPGIRGAWVKEPEVDVADGKIAGYKVIMKLTFVLDAEKGRAAGTR